MTRNRIVLVVFAALALIASGVSVSKLGGSRDVVHAEQSADPRVLSWSPPELTDPITVTVGDNPIVYLDEGRDYRVVFPNTPVRHRITIDGGRNVVVVGGEINIPWQGDDAPIYQRRGLLIRGQTGTIHIEGLLITGEDLSEGINIAAPDAIVQLQNIRVEHVHARDQVGFSDNHPDVIQPWGGVGELRVDRLSGQTDYQGIFLKEDYGPIGSTILRRVHISGDPTARYLYWNHDSYDVTLDRAYVSPAPGRSLDATLWPDAQSWSGINVGAPPEGEFVPRDLVGIGYQAWPYADADEPPAPVNVAPSVIASAPESAEVGVDVALNGSVSDDGVPGPLTVRWSQASGPGAVLFASATDVDTMVSFPVTGVYALSLTADDGALSATSTVTMTVAAPPAPVNVAPSVIASAPGSAEVGVDVALNGSVSDDGVPGPLTVRWSQASGPGAVLFASATDVDTIVSFPVTGVYALSLTADDGALSATSTVTMTVTAPPTEPMTVTETFSGSLNKKWFVRSFDVSVGEGPVNATLTVGGKRGRKSGSDVVALVVSDSTGSTVARSSGTGVVELSVELAAGVYTLEVSGGPSTFTLDVVHLQ